MSIFSHTSDSLLKLGKQPPKYDSHTLKLARYVDLTAAPTPPAETQRAVGMSWPMFANDRLGDCTIAGMAHMIEFWMARSNDANDHFSITDDNVVEAYSAVSNYNPQTGENDNGAIEIDVLKWWQINGISGHRISAYAAVNLPNHDLVRLATWLFDGLYIGVALPMSAQGKEDWTYLPATGSQSYPGTWGGHCVNVVDYNAVGPVVITWGASKQMTWDFWDHYCDEAYAIISPEELTGTGRTVEGFDASALLSDLERIR